MGKNYTWLRQPAKCASMRPMSYVKDMLGHGEKIVTRAETSRIAILTALCSFAVLMHPFSILRLARTELALTDRRIIGTTGVGGRKNLVLLFKDVESVTVRRGLLGWMFDYGSVIVTGKGGNSVHFRGILWPLVFQQEADEAIERAVLGYTLAEYVPPV